MLHFCVEKCFCVKFDILIDVLVKSGEVKVNCGANAGAIESVSVAIDHGFLRKKNERNINNRSQKDALSLIHVELVRQTRSKLRCRCGLFARDAVIFHKFYCI